MSKLKEDTLVLNQGESNEIELKSYIGGERNTVTVVFRPVPKRGGGENKKYHVGVSRCGDNERYSKELGTNIAVHRSAIQPYAILHADNDAVLRGVAESIISHMDCAKQPQLQNCIRLPKNKVKSKTRQNQKKAVETN
jgi:hypothetical protein